MGVRNMSGGDYHQKHHLINFHHHIPHLHFHHDHHKQQQQHHGDKEFGIPKGCLAVLVGREGEDGPQRFVIPVMYINHPLFMELLKETEDEFGFDHKGPITIPCHIEEFRSVQGIIDKENSAHLHHGHHHCPAWCFSV